MRPLFDLFYDRKFEDRNDRNFYLSVSKNYGPDVVELGCGTGRILLELWKAGVQAYGVDISKRRIEICRQKLEKIGVLDPSAYVSVGDIRSVSLKKTFDLALMPFRVFQFLLEPDDQERCLNTTRSLLKDGGHLLIDIYNPSIPRLADVGASDKTIWEDSGTKVSLTDSFEAVNYAKQIATYSENYFITYPDGKSETASQKYRMRYTFRTELTYLLRLTGFSVVEVFSDYDRTPASDSNAAGETLILSKKIAPCLIC